MMNDAGFIVLELRETISDGSIPEWSGPDLGPSLSLSDDAHGAHVTLSAGEGRYEISASNDRGMFDLTPDERGLPNLRVVGADGTPILVNP